MFDERPQPNVTAQLSIPLSTIGIITGIVLCILQGVGTINIGWFWATFPFWIVPAVTLSLLSIVLIIIAIISIAEDRARARAHRKYLNAKK